MAPFPAAAAPYLVAAVFVGGLVAIAVTVFRQTGRATVMLAGALRCSQCRTNWPRLNDSRGRAVFAPCPECAAAGLESRLDTMVTATAIDVELAWSRKRHADFEVFGREWDAKRLAEFEAAALAEIAALEEAA